MRTIVPYLLNGVEKFTANKSQCCAPTTIITLTVSSTANNDKMYHGQLYGMCTERHASHWIYLLVTSVLYWNKRDYGAHDLAITHRATWIQSILKERLGHNIRRMLNGTNRCLIVYHKPFQFTGHISIDWQIWTCWINSMQELERER